jgi:hypothetical protein
MNDRVHTHHRRRWLFVVVAMPLAASAIFACSLITNLDGLSGGAAADGSSDALVARDGGGLVDGPSEGSASEAGADGSTEAGATCPPYVLPATCAPQFLTDDKNCCIAGRDCQGGGCVGGKCQPVTVVADATGDARGLGVSNDQLLWATGCTGIVRRVRKDGAGNTALPAGTNCTPTLAVGGTWVYWVEFNGPFLNRTAIDGSGAPKIVAENPLSGSRANFSRLAVDAQRAYWANDSPGSVWFAPLDGDHTTAVPIAAVQDAGLTMETATSPYGIAVDATYVYWSDRGAGIIKRRALSSLGTDILADVVTSDSQPGELALDATRIYWVTSDGFVRSHAKDGSGATVALATGEASAETLVVDDQYVYWARHVIGSDVKRVPKSGGPEEVLAKSQAAPWSLAQDCTSIYWTNHNNFGTGQVMKVTK